jgi:hypothetical protein
LTIDKAGVSINLQFASALPADLLQLVIVLKRHYSGILIRSFCLDIRGHVGHIATMRAWLGNGGKGECQQHCCAFNFCRLSQAVAADHASVT